MIGDPKYLDCNCGTCVEFRLKRDGRPISKTGCYYCGAQTKTNPPKSPFEKKDHHYSCPERNT